MIFGNVDTREVTVNGIVLDYTRSQELFNHSPGGGNWGYGGSGPAQLALALLLAFSEDTEFALRYHQEFKAEVLMPRNMDDDLWLDETVVVDWINRRVEREVVTILFDWVRDGRVK